MRATILGALVVVTSWSAFGAQPDDKKENSIGNDAIREAIQLLEKRSKTKGTGKTDQDKINEGIAVLEKILRDGEPRPSKEEVVAVTAEQLSADYGENKIAADKKYKGAILEVTGVVAHVITYSLGGRGLQQPCVSLKTKHSWPKMLFAPSDADQIEKLKKGDKVTIRGKGIGTDDTYPLCQDCKVVK